MTAFVIDIACFLVLPVVCWRVLRGAVPMAVLPILAGLAIAIAANRFGFDKNILGPSQAGEAIGWVGVLILAFSAGLETRTMARGPKFGSQFIGSAIAALSLPFFVGLAITFSGVIDPILVRPENVNPWLSAAAIGLCLAVSALPVLVGIVRELPAADRAIGNLALRIAALDDAILWAGLAVLLFLHNDTASGVMSATWQDAVAIALFIVMILARKALDRIASPHPVIALAAGACYLAAGAWATTALGLHELLGAYFAGALVPAGFAARMRPELIGKIALFGFSPLFFAHRGLSIDGSLVTPAALGLAAVLLLVAMATKLAAVQIAPPLPNMSATEKTRLGLLLQCKGLMEIVAASILLQNGLLSPNSFAILVALAIVSTTITIPLFNLASRLFATNAAPKVAA